MTPAFDDPRLERLASKLSEASSNGAVTLAYSGGLDSRFLAFFAKLAGFRVRLLHVTGPVSYTHLPSSFSRPPRSS